MRENENSENFLFCNMSEKSIHEQPISDDDSKVIEQINSEILNFTDLKELASYIYNNTQKLVPCDILAVGFLEEEGKRITIQSIISTYQLNLLTEGANFDIKNTALVTIMEYSYPLIINDLASFMEDRPHYLMGKLLLNEGVGSAMICPLKVQDKPLGFIFRSSRKPYQFNGHHITISAALIPRIAQILEKGYIIHQLSTAINSYMEILGFVTHELKSPLDTIITMGNTLTGGYKGKLTQDQNTYIRKMTRKAQYLRELTDEYLTLSRFESEKIPLNLQPVSFSENLLTDIIDLYSPQMDDKNITIELNIDDDLPDIKCDPSLIKIVLSNLMSNAIKYNIDKGTIRMSAKLKAGKIIFSVWNTGPGFSPEGKKSLFKKFSRIESDELMKQKGSGIGLYTSWKIVQLHNGRIWANSTEGKWAEFGLLLPVDGSPEYELL
jgi:signal transduction histidine kinase